MDAGELFVKLRPNASGFTSEATGPIAAAAGDLSRVFVAAFAVGGIAKTIESVVGAATSHQTAFAVLDQTVKNAGASNDLYGLSIEKLLEKEARLKGFSDEELAAGFQRIVSVTHDSASAFSDLGKAEDLARFRHIDLAAAALAVSKAEQGSVTALQRYGIVVPHATEATDRLKAAHDAAVASGAKFTDQQKLLYAQALKNAAAQDAEGKKTEALALIQERAGGSAAKFALTASGQFARARQDFHQLEVVIGQDLLPTLATGAEGLGKFFTELSNNQQVQKDAAQLAHDIGIAIGTLKTDFETIGPPLVTVVEHLGGLNHTLEILGGLVLGRKLASALIATGDAELVVGADAVTANRETKTFLGTLGKLALIGTIGIPIIVHFEKDAPKDLGPVGNFIAGIPGLGAAFKAGAGAGTDAGKALDKKIADLLNPGDVAAPETAKSMMAFTDQLIKDGIIKPLPRALDEAIPLVGSTFKLGGFKVGQAASADLLKGLRDGIATDQADLAQLKIDMADAVRQGAEAVDQAVQSGKQNFNAIGQSLAGSLATFIDKPLNDAQQALTAQGDRIALEFDTLGATLAAKAAELGLETQQLQATQQARSAIFAGDTARLDQQDAAATLKAQQRSALFAGLSAELDRESARLGLRNDERTLERLRTQILLPGGHKLATDPKKALAELQALAKTRKSPALEDFIAQFEGASIAVTKDRVGIAEAPTAGEATNAANRRTARDRIAAVGLPSPEEARRSAHLLTETTANALETARLAARRQVTETGLQLKNDGLRILVDAATTEKQIAQQTIANLTDLFNKGEIPFSTFSSRLAGLLKKDHLSFAAAGKVDGIAFADTFAAQLTGLGLQHAASAAGPQRPGTGLVPSIIRPLESLAQVNKQIASLASQERAKQLDETKKQTVLLTKIAGQTKATAFTNSLDKNPGAANQRAKELVGVGG